MRFEEACGGWQERRLTQEEAARLPRLAKDLRYLDRRRYEHAAHRLGEVGRLVGGMRRRRSPVRPIHRLAGKLPD